MGVLTRPVDGNTARAAFPRSGGARNADANPGQDLNQYIGTGGLAGVESDYFTVSYIRASSLFASPGSRVDRIRTSRIMIAQNNPTNAVLVLVGKTVF